MKKMLSVLCLAIISISYAYGQTHWKAKLHEDLVTVENGKYTTTEYQLLKFQNGASIQMGISATAELESMNRDNFVSIYTTLTVFTIMGILSEAGLSIDDVEFEDLDEPIGEPDIKLLFTMTKNGLQMAVTTEDGTERETMTWAEFFEENW